MPTLELAPRGPRPPIRVRPAPRCEPPFDDEAAVTPWADQLAFEFPQRRADRRNAPRDCDEMVHPPQARPVVAGASWAAKFAVRRFVQMCVEVLNGYRPAAHLRRLSLPKEASGVVAQAMAGTSRVAELRRSRSARTSERRDRPAAPRSTDRRDRGPGPVGVIGLQLCEPRPGAVEAAVLLVTGDRTWAMALRLELHHERWCAAALRLI